MKRRDFLKVVMASVLALSRKFRLSHVLADDALYFVIPPTLLHVGETTAMIGYWLSQITDSGVLRVFDQDGVEVQTLPLLTDRAVITVEGLAPSSPYSYRIEVGGGVPPYLDFAEMWGGLSFHTQPYEWPLRFAAIGDSGFGDSTTIKLAEHIAAHDIHAFLHLGDVVYNSHEHDNNLPLNWALKYYRPFYKILQRVPHYAVFGNHDRETTTLWEGVPFYFYAFPPLNEADAWKGQRRWFSTTFNNVRLLGLDTQCFYTDLCIGEENDWFDRQLVSAIYRTNIVLFHIPFWTSATIHPFDGQVVSETWGQRLKDAAEHIGVVLNGHAHLYERLYRGDVHYITSGGGSNAIYGHADTPVTGSQVVRSLANYVIVEVYPDQIQVTAYDIDNTVIDQSSWEI